ncbi:MAG TPA: glycine betaine ABC transporter substrate-binding protein [Gaiellaceae bacterium]|nr:glycine betaine ABC transporter substrate-binding protein [Gaiellaceae bacterium]
MSFRSSRRRRTLVAGVVLVATAALAVSGSAFGRGGQSCGTVVINEQSWAGSTANTYVAKNVLEKRLGCTVKITNITEGTPYFQAMRDGKIDVALEDWDNTLLKSAQPYIKDRSVRVVGSNGISGVIGWYIPRYLLKQYPAFASWKGLKGKETVFKSPESGSQGMFLGGDPSYVQKDRALIKELGLNLKHVVAGAEPAQIARWTQLYKQKKPVLFYWYDPQYLNGGYDLVRVKLPARFKGCVDNEKDPGNHACEYPGYPSLDKLISAKFATSGSPALKFVRKFKWTATDQNFVAFQIAGKKLKPEKAAEQWVKANAAKVNAWLK